MRKLLTWLLVTLGIAALIRKLRRRSGQPEPTWSSASVASETPQRATEPPPQPAAEDPADELRRKLAETKSEEETVAEGSVDERRADVHEQARATLDEMKPPEG
jgi:hypothetical protein